METTTPNTNPEEFEYIERYLLHQLNKEDHLAFEEKMARDQTFSKKVGLQRALIQGVEEKAFKKKIDGFHKIFEEEQDTPTPVRRLTKQPWFYAAASIFLLISVGSFLFINKAKKNERLFERYYFSDPGLPTVMGSNEDYDFSRAMVDYKQGNYKDAIQKWQALLTHNSNVSDTLNYFLGTAYLESQDEIKAIEYLKKVAAKNTSIFKDEAGFYLGMTYLKKGNIVKAKEYFQNSSLDESKALLFELK